MDGIRKKKIIAIPVHGEQLVISVSEETRLPCGVSNSMRIKRSEECRR